ncbi:MAG: tryptophan 7-halogenase [Candidatus Rokubacteria bacterium]|nr:tryptophan 7-halogenase [Candidatus Rokubacteria bacterium]
MVNIPKKCDVVVIGGGPSGSAAAAFLRQRGYDVVLFEKKKHPRYQVGESLVPQFWKFCDAAKATDKILAEGFIQKAGGTVAWNGVIRQTSFKQFGYKRPALHVERDRFDHILIDHARENGAKIFEEVIVLGANLERSGGPSVTYRPLGEKTPSEIACRFVVDATGQSALIGRQLDLRVIDDDFRFMTVWGYFTNSMYIALDGRAYPHEQVKTIPPTTFVSSTGKWGWSWHIPLRKTTSVGLIIPQEEVQAVKASDEALQGYFLRKCAETPYLGRLLEPARFSEENFHVMRHYSYRPKALTGPGFFLIGDSAAFIDPIFSEGCLLAFYSAFLAAWAIDRSFRHPERTVESQAVFTRQFAGRYEVGHALAMPRFGGTGKASDVARMSINFDSAQEQELMYVASTMAERSENLVELTQKKWQGAGSEKFRVLETIAF